MHLIPEAIEQYCELYTSSVGGVLNDIAIETHKKVLMPQMLSGHLQGAFLSMISYMIRPDQILEIGTYTGYSAICLAQGLKEGGRLHTLEINDELEDMITANFDKAGIAEKVRLHIGNAVDIIPQIPGEFDLVFIDADKTNYLVYYEMIVERVRPGGFILADNVLWSGKVVEEKKDKDTATLHSYNERIQSDERVENMLLPLRDGIMMARRK